MLGTSLYTREAIIIAMLAKADDIASNFLKENPMIYVVNLIKNIALALLSVLDIAMFARAILSWIDPRGDGPMASFLYAITEPIILPFRKLFDKMNWFVGSPIDMPFLFAVFAIIILQTILEVLV